MTPTLVVPRPPCKDLMHVLAIKNVDKAALKDILSGNGIAWREHGADIPGRTPDGRLVDPEDPGLVAYIELFLEAK